MEDKDKEEVHSKRETNRIKKLECVKTDICRKEKNVKESFLNAKLQISFCIYFYV
jgi:hypothetical protein